MSVDNSNPNAESDLILDIHSGKPNVLDLPDFGRIQTLPFLNIGTVMDIEQKMSGRPSAAELVDTVFGGRAQIEGSDGTLRRVTKDEVKRLTDQDRLAFAQGFLTLVRGEGEVVEDSESPVEALAAYAVAEWQAAKKSRQEIADLAKAGFSQKTIDLFKNSQFFAEQVAAVNRLPYLAEIAKLGVMPGGLGSAIASASKGLDLPAIKAAIGLHQTPNWKDVTGFSRISGVKYSISPKTEDPDSLERTEGAFENTAIGLALGQSPLRYKSKTLATNGPPMFKSAEQMMKEEIGSLRNALGDCTDRVGNAAANIALQQDMTNSMIVSALADMRNRWKEDERSSRTALLVAVCSLVVSVMLTGFGVLQDRWNNESDEKYQRQATQLMEQQKEIEERQRQLLDQLVKANEAMLAARKK